MPAQRGHGSPAREQTVVDLLRDAWLQPPSAAKDEGEGYAAQRPPSVLMEAVMHLMHIRVKNENSHHE